MDHVILSNSFSSYTYMCYQNKHLILLFSKKKKTKDYLVCVQLQPWEFLYVTFLTE